MEYNPVTYPNAAPQDLSILALQQFYESLPTQAPEGAEVNGKKVITRISIMPKNDAKHIFNLPLEGNKNVWLDLAKTYCAALERPRSSYQVQALVKAAVKLGLRVKSPYIVGGEVKDVDDKLEAEHLEDDSPKPQAMVTNGYTVRTRLSTAPAPKRATVVTLLGENPLPREIHTADGLSQQAVNENLVWLENELKTVDSWRDQVNKRAGELTAKYEAQKAELLSKQKELVKAYELKQAEELKARLAELTAKYPELAPQPEPIPAKSKGRGQGLKDLKQLKGAVAK